MADSVSSQRQILERGDLVRFLYRLGRRVASGILTLTVDATQDAAPIDPMSRRSGSPRAEIFVLRRGAVVLADGELAKRGLIGRLVRLAALDRLHATFDANIAAYPPGSQNHLPLAGWARSHLEKQLDATLAEILVRELAGARVSVHGELAPDPATCDETDRRMLAALAQPRRLDQVWSLARTPRFRLLAFIHFLKAVDALDMVGVAAERSTRARAIDPRREAARRLLGLARDADLEAIKRAYRRLARELHPDLQPTIGLAERRLLERRFAELTAAYEALI